MPGTEVREPGRWPSMRKDAGRSRRRGVRWASRTPGSVPCESGTSRRGRSGSSPSRTSPTRPGLGSGRSGSHPMAACSRAGREASVASSSPSNRTRPSRARRLPHTLCSVRPHLRRPAASGLGKPNWRRGPTSTSSSSSISRGGPPAGSRPTARDSSGAAFGVGPRHRYGRPRRRREGGARHRRGAAPPARPRGADERLAVSPDERWIATSSDQSISVWPMPDVTKPPLHALPPRGAAGEARRAHEPAGRPRPGLGHRLEARGRPVPRLEGRADVVTRTRTATPARRRGGRAS